MPEATHRSVYLNGFDIALHAARHAQLSPARKPLGLLLLFPAPTLIP